MRSNTNLGDEYVCAFCICSFDMGNPLFLVYNSSLLRTHCFKPMQHSWQPGAQPPPAVSAGCQRCEPSRSSLAVNRRYLSLLITGLPFLGSLALARRVPHF